MIVAFIAQSAGFEVSAAKSCPAAINDPRKTNKRITFLLWLEFCDHRYDATGCSKFQVGFPNAASATADTNASSLSRIFDNHRRTRRSDRLTNNSAAGLVPSASHRLRTQPDANHPNPPPPMPSC